MNTSLHPSYLSNWGFTIGIDDVQPNPIVMGKKANVTAIRMKSIDGHINDYNNGALTLKPGCNADETLEALINADLSAIREDVGDSCNADLPLSNKVQTMTTCGSKGSAMNLCQMMALLGQQNVCGARIKDGFVNRTLPLFKVGIFFSQLVRGGESSNKCTRPRFLCPVRDILRSSLIVPQVTRNNCSHRKLSHKCAVPNSSHGEKHFQFEFIIQSKFLTPGVRERA